MIDYVDVYSESDGKIALAWDDIELLLNFEEAMALHIDLGNALQEMSDFANQMDNPN